jgi:hypothetical protein
MLTHAGSSCGKERRALLAGARDACYVAIAGFQEVGEEGMAAQGGGGRLKRVGGERGRENPGEEVQGGVDPWVGDRQ